MEGLSLLPVRAFCSESFAYFLSTRSTSINKNLRRSSPSGVCSANSSNTFLFFDQALIVAADIGFSAR